MGKAVTIQPELPPVDFNIAQAYNEILNRVPSRFLFEIHESGSFEESEDGSQSCKPAAPKGATMPRLFVQPEERNLNIVGQEKNDSLSFVPSFCFDADQKAGGLRVLCKLQV